MSRLAAKLLARIGVTMVVLCIACRFIIHTESGIMGDNLAIIASLALTVVAMVYLRIAPHDDKDRVRAAKAASGAGANRAARK